MSSDDRDVIVLQGTVLAEHGGGLHAIECELEAGMRHRVLARRSGKLVKRHVWLTPGDSVQVEVSGYDPTRGRIVWRGDRSSRAA